MTGTASLFLRSHVSTPVFVTFPPDGAAPVGGAIAVGLQQSHRRIPVAALPSGVVIPNTASLVLDVELAPTVMKITEKIGDLLKIVTVLDDLLFRLRESLKLFRVRHFLSSNRRRLKFPLPFCSRTSIALLSNSDESFVGFQVTPITDGLFDAEEVVGCQIPNLQGPERGAVKAPVISMCRDHKEQNEGGDNGI